MPASLKNKAAAKTSDSDHAGQERLTKNPLEELPMDELEERFRDASARERDATFNEINARKNRDTVLEDLKKHADHEPLDKNAVIDLARSLSKKQHEYDHRKEQTKKARTTLESIQEVRGSRR